MKWAQPGADALLAGATFPTTFHIKLHLGDPTDDGTANPAADTRRIEFDTGPQDPPVAGAVTSATFGEILNATTTETVTHITLWDASSAGTVWFVHELAAPLEITAGETVAVAEEQLNIVLPLWT